jgi:hypothetical protein
MIRLYTPLLHHTIAGDADVNLYLEESTDRGMKVGASGKHMGDACETVNGFVSNLMDIGSGVESEKSKIAWIWSTITTG